MAADKAHAVVIRAVPFGETSAVVTLYTRELGKLRAVMNTYVAHVLGRKSRLSPRLVPVIPPRSTPSRDA